MSIRLRAVATLLAAAVLASCAPETLDPAAVDECGALVPIGQRLVEDYLVVVDQLSLDQITGAEQPPAELIELQIRGAALDRRVVALECDASVVNREIAAATAELSADSVAGATFLEVVRSGAVGRLPTFVTGADS